MARIVDAVDDDVDGAEGGGGAVRCAGDEAADGGERTSSWLISVCGCSWS
jgi:hypothetical protein